MFLPKNIKEIGVIFISLLLGGLLSLGGSQGGKMIDSVPVFLICAILSFAINWLSFFPANFYKTEKYYDLMGSLTYVTLITVACFLSLPVDLRSGLIAMMVMFWAIRLGSFLFFRVRRDGGDRRFDRIKNSPLRFFMAWTLQGVWALFTSASALVILTNENRVPLDVFALIGIAIWLIGFAIEVIADQQKRAFRKSVANKDRFIASGLWAWSQHPNYFGEILMWTGITIVSLPLLIGWQWVTVVSPFFVALLLIRVSGIPMLEEHANKKWRHEPAYVDYCAAVPKLIPARPRSR